jgi:hypothetical protein
VKAVLSGPSSTKWIVAETPLRFASSRT